MSNKEYLVAYHYTLGSVGYPCPAPYQDLPLHCDDKQDDEVEHQDGPEDRNVEERKTGAEKSNEYCSCHSQPEEEERHEMRARSGLLQVVQPPLLLGYNHSRWAKCNHANNAV